MGDGTEQSPYTREDVLNLIKENGGTAKWLNLSNKWFEKRIVLTERDLEGVILEGAHLEEVILIGANLKGAFLHNAHLEDANLSGAHLNDAFSVSVHLEKAELFGAHLEGTEFFDAHFEEANLIDAFLDRTRLSGAHLHSIRMRSAKFTANTKMESVDWGNFIVGEEKEWEEKKKETYLLRDAEDIYRRLKQWYTYAGLYDIAGKFFFREMTAKRKAMKWWPNPLNRAFSKLLSILCGYGEKPEIVVRSALATILSLALAYRLWGSFNTSSIWDMLYYSAVSFISLGYGNWAPQPTGWAKGIGALEAFVGFFMMTLFLVTFTRKMTR